MPIGGCRGGGFVAVTLEVERSEVRLPGRAWHEEWEREDAPN